MKSERIAGEGRPEAELLRRVMPKPQKRILRFGDLITAVYDAYGKAKATGILRQAVNTRAVGFLGARHYRIN